MGLPALKYLIPIYPIRAPVATTTSPCSMGV
jgi:hypothetical protein